MEATTHHRVALIGYISTTCRKHFNLFKQTNLPTKNRYLWILYKVLENIREGTKCSLPCTKRKLKSTIRERKINFSISEVLSRRSLAVPLHLPLRKESMSLWKWITLNVYYLYFKKGCLVENQRFQRKIHCVWYAEMFECRYINSHIWCMRPSSAPSPVTGQRGREM